MYPVEDSRKNYNTSSLASGISFFTANLRNSFWAMRDIISSSCV